MPYLIYSVLRATTGSFLAASLAGTNPEINVSEFIIYDDIFKTDEPNSPGIYLKNNECYIRYKDITFNKSEDEIGEDMKDVFCNGYYTVILADSVKPIVEDTENPKYNYRYLGYYEDNGYHFAYRSYYDGSGLVVSIDKEIKTEFIDVNNLELKKISNTSYKKYILPAIILLVLIGTIIILKKKNKV